VAHERLNKAEHAAYMREWRKAHRKDICRSYASVYLKRGLLKRLPRKLCGATAQMHHPNYDKPLDVIWLCRNHHTALHATLA
jgi:hypothetical protein